MQVVLQRIPAGTRRISAARMARQIPMWRLTQVQYSCMRMAAVGVPCFVARTWRRKAQSDQRAVKGSVRIQHSASFRDRVLCKGSPLPSCFGKKTLTIRGCENLSSPSRQSTSTLHVLAMLMITTSGGYRCTEFGQKAGL